MKHNRSLAKIGRKRKCSIYFELERSSRPGEKDIGLCPAASIIKLVVQETIILLSFRRAPEPKRTFIKVRILATQQHHPPERSPLARRKRSNDEVSKVVVSPGPPIKVVVPARAILLTSSSKLFLRFSHSIRRWRVDHREKPEKLRTMTRTPAPLFSPSLLLRLSTTTDLLGPGEAVWVRNMQLNGLKMKLSLGVRWTRMLL